MNIEILMQNILKESAEVLVLYEATENRPMDTECLSEEEGSDFREDCVPQLSLMWVTDPILLARTKLKA